MLENHRGTSHNPIHKARFVALGAMLALVQACGGGGGDGDSPMIMAADCRGTTPIFENGACRPANNMSECPAAMPVFDMRVNGNCRAQRLSECMGGQTIRNGVCTDPTCLGTTPVLGSDRVCRRAQTNAECAGLSTAEPIVAGDGSCRPPQTSAECASVSLALPIYGASGRCRPARSDAECASVSRARPVFVSDGTCQSTRVVLLPLATSIDPAQQARYDAVVAAAQQRPRASATQGGHGLRGTTSDLVQIILGGDPAVLSRVKIVRDFENNDDRDNTAAGRILSVADGTETEAPAPSNAAADRRVRPNENLGGWNYTTRALAATQAQKDAIQARLADSQLADDAARLDDGVVDFKADVVEWANTEDDGYYMAGGIWAYEVAETIADALTATSDTQEVVGAFVGGNPAHTLNRPLPDTRIAIYAGHSFGMYTTLPALAGETTNRGYFAARAHLTARFTNSSSDPSAVSGTIDNFLFSRDKGFTAGVDPALEEVFSFMVITLEPGVIGPGVPVFGAETSSDGVIYDGSELELTGRWGGRFYGTPENTGEAPLGMAGTWGAAGTTPTAPADGGFGISFIGAFGAKKQPFR